MKRIITTIAAKYGLSVEKMLGRRRKTTICEPRHFAMYEIKRVSGWSLPRIGKIMGGRDHTTVLNGIRNTRAMIESHPMFAAFVSAVEQEIDEL